MTTEEAFLSFRVSIAEWSLCLCTRGRRLYVPQRVRESEGERESERERESVCVCVCERERERVCVCV